MNTDVMLQDVRKFTVQIRRDDNGDIIGTGIVVSNDGTVVTCAHVVEVTGIALPAPGTPGLTVYFPAKPGRPGELRPATVRALLPDSEDDLICLQVGGPLPLPSEYVAVLGSAAASRRHRFESYGFRRLHKYLGGRADGRIMGEVDPPDGCVLLLDPVQLESSQINSGMSGSAVLDVERNLVVGIVSEAWFAETDGKDRDTAWAVNAKVLEFTDLGLSIWTAALPRARAPLPNFDPALAHKTVPVPGHRLDDAPGALGEWVGRERALAALAQEGHRGEHLVVGLIGFGGEGKSSLARRWIDTLPDTNEDDLAGVFWWSFTERANADEFLAAALEFMSAGRIAPSDLPSGEARASFVAGLLRTHRYVFILDGLEVMQYQEGDQYGSIISPALRDFLGYFATPSHHSFCLITSRAPVLDLAKYVTYLHVDVQALTVEAGSHLLRKLGTVGSDAALAQVVKDWDGHALTLSLLAGYLVKRYQGDARRVVAIPAPDPSLPRSEFVRRVLFEYDACLNEQERDFLVHFSVFRTPVTDEAMRLIVPTELLEGGWENFKRETLGHLIATRILRLDTARRTSMHPLVRDFYANQTNVADHRRQELHRMIAVYYLETAEQQDAPDLEALGPIVEAVHHLTRADRFDEAADVLYDRLYLGERGFITRELNAYEIVLAALLDFFPGQELHREPLVGDSETRSWLLHEVATCLQMLGRMRDAAAVTRRAVQAFKARESWHEAAISCQNMVELHIALGALAACATLVDDAFDLAERAADQEDLLVAETLKGTVAHLTGSPETAAGAFAEALRIATEFTPLPILYSSSGVRYADHLRRSGNLDEARKAVLANLRVCRTASWRADEVSCQVGLGDLAVDAGDLTGGYERYDEAVRTARCITRRDVLIDALLGRGRCALLSGHTDAARSDLEDALTLAILGGFRLAEIDARVILARLHHASGDPLLAREEAIRAEQMSIEVGYHWGRVDAAHALAGIDGTG